MDVLAALPSSMQKGVIEQIKRKRRVITRDRLLPHAGDPAMYSSMQLRNFLGASALNRKVAKMQSRMNENDGVGHRIASEPNKKYVLYDYEDEVIVGDGSGDDAAGGGGFFSADSTHGTSAGKKESETTLPVCETRMSHPSKSSLNLESKMAFSDPKSEMLPDEGPMFKSKSVPMQSGRPLDWNRLPSNAAPTRNGDDEKIKSLQQLGPFSHRACQDALERCGGDVDLSADILLQNDADEGGFERPVAMQNYSETGGFQPQPHSNQSSSFVGHVAVNAGDSPALKSAIGQIQEYASVTLHDASAAAPLSFPGVLSTADRHKCHQLADSLGLQHASSGGDFDRRLTVWRGKAQPSAATSANVVDTTGAVEKRDMEDVYSTALKTADGFGSGWAGFAVRRALQKHLPRHKNAPSLDGSQTAACVAMNATTGGGPGEMPPLKSADSGNGLPGSSKQEVPPTHDLIETSSDDDDDGVDEWETVNSTSTDITAPTLEGATEGEGFTGHIKSWNTMAPKKVTITAVDVDVEVVNAAVENSTVESVGTASSVSVVEIEDDEDDEDSDDENGVDSWERVDSGDKKLPAVGRTEPERFAQDSQGGQNDQEIARGKSINVRGGGDENKVENEVTHVKQVERDAVGNSGNQEAGKDADSQALGTPKVFAKEDTEIVLRKEVQQVQNRPGLLNQEVQSQKGDTSESAVLSAQEPATLEEKSDTQQLREDENAYTAPDIALKTHAKDQKDQTEKSEMAKVIEQDDDDEFEGEFEDLLDIDIDSLTNACKLYFYPRF